MNPLVVTANDVDITRFCTVDEDKKRITLPDNMPDECRIVCSRPGYRFTNALLRETSAQRKRREAAEATIRAHERTSPLEVIDEPASPLTLSILTYSIWAALYGLGNQPHYNQPLFH